jgi:flagellar biosynthesis regulator FlbT
MQKLTVKHYVNIISITTATLNAYKQFVANMLADELSDDNDATMYANDIAYMSDVLNTFKKCKDVKQLQNSIMLQDTFVREEFIDTLLYIEKHNLSDEYYCI